MIPGTGAYLKGTLQAGQERRHETDGIPAIPPGSAAAWFSVFEEFIDVRATDGSVNFRVPKCGVDEVGAPLLRRWNQTDLGNDAARSLIPLGARRSARPLPGDFVN